jgi:integrase
VDNVRLRVCSPAEIQTLLAGASADLALIARVTLESLLRLSEVLALRHEHRADVCTVVQSKSGKPRRVPLTPELRADLLARCHATSGCVFGVGKTGHPPTAAAVSVAFARLAASLNLKGVSHHVLRHTGATVMVAAGVRSVRCKRSAAGRVCAWSSGTRTSMTRSSLGRCASRSNTPRRPHKRSQRHPRRPEIQNRN